MTELLDLFSSAISGLTAELVSNLGGAGSNLEQQLNALAAKAQLSGTVYPQADGESTGYALLWLPEGDALQLVAQLGPAGPATIQLYASPVRVTLYGGTSVPGVSIGPLWIRVATEAAAPDETVADTRRFSLEGSFWVSLDQKKGLNFDNFSLTIPPFTLGTTGVVLSIDKAIPHFLAGSIPLEFDPLKLPLSFRGLLLAGSTAVLPPSLTFAGFDTLSAPIAAIGTGGFTGTFDMVNTAPELKDPKTPPPFTPATGTYDCKGAGKILGFAAAMRKITLSFQSSALTASEITAVLRLPGFDKDVEANAFLSLDGKLTVAITNLQNLGTLKIDGIAEFTPESIVLSNSGEGPAYISLAGKLTPLLQTDIFNWPTLDIRALRIDTAGNLSFDGGWLELPKAVSISLFGFQLEVTKIAFGSDSPSRKWFGLSASVKLIDGMPAGASADGLRISWSVDAFGKPVPGSFGFSFDGIGVAFEIPDVLKFSGSVSMKTDPAKPGDTRFEGAVSLDLLALGVTVDATVVFGRQKDQPYLGIYLAADIPSAIPLFSTGLGIYGIDALACLNMKPNKDPGQAWYSIETTGWFQKDPIGVTGIDKKQKWTPAAGNFAFGAGVTIGTVDDNGRKFNGKFLLLILLPGPVILLQGQANLMRERAKLNDDPQFRALAALDVPAGTLTFGLDAKYAYPDDGGIVRISGSTEAYFNLNDFSDWHIWVGKDKPMTQRIQAELLSLFTAKAYLMLDSKTGVRTGCWAGFQKQWDYGVVKLDLEAWVDGNVAVSVMPPQFHGDLTLQATARLTVFGVKLGLSVHSALVVEVCDPFDVTGELKVAAELPWPLDDWSTTATLHWTKPPAKVKNAPPKAESQWPQIPAALQGVAFGHPLQAASWPIERSSGALSPADANGQGFFQLAPPADEAAAPTAKLSDAAPVVPADGRLELSFARPVGDKTYLGGATAWQDFVRSQIGNPTKGAGPVAVDLQVQSADLQWWNGTSWEAGTDEDMPGLAGAWQPGETAQAPEGAGQVKLWLQGASPWDWSTPLLAALPGSSKKYVGDELPPGYTGDGGDGTGGGGNTGGEPPGSKWLSLDAPGGSLPPSANGPAPGPPQGGGAGGATEEPSGWQAVSLGGIEVSWPASNAGPAPGTGEGNPHGLTFYWRSESTGLIEVWLQLPRQDSDGVTLYVHGAVGVTAWDKGNVKVADFAWPGAKAFCPIGKPNITWILLRATAPFELLGVALWPAQT